MATKALRILLSFALAASAFAQEAAVKYNLSTSAPITNVKYPDPTANTDPATRGWTSFGGADYIQGREYMAHYYDVVQANARKPIIALCGDSTLAGEAIVDPNWDPAAIVQRIGDRAIKRGVTILDDSVGATTTTQWVSTYMPLTLADNPDVVVIGTGLNDTLNDADFEAKYRELLELCRAHGDVSELTIIVMAPNSSDVAASHAVPAWHERRYHIYEELAREYECAFIGRYPLAKDSTRSATIWMDIHHLHPLDNLNVTLITPLCDLLFPRLIDWTYGGGIYVNPDGVANIGGVAWLTGAYAGTRYYPRSGGISDYVDIYNTSGSALTIAAEDGGQMTLGNTGLLSLSGSGTCLQLNPRSGSTVFQIVNNDGSQLMLYNQTTATVVLGVSSAGSLTIPANQTITFGTQTFRPPETKTDTGDYASGNWEGRMVINTFDNTFKVYAEGAWRSLATW